MAAHHAKPNQLGSNPSSLPLRGSLSFGAQFPGELQDDSCESQFDALLMLDVAACGDHRT
jgi:hypothetical protein